MRNVIYLSDGVTEVTGIVQGSFHWRSSVNPGSALRLGAVCTSTIEFDVFGDQASAISGGETLYYKWLNDDNTLTDKGIYTARPVISGRNTYHVVAVAGGDGINKDYSQRLSSIKAQFPMTLKALAEDVCAWAGFALDGLFLHYNDQVDAFEAPGATCRQMLSWIAELSGGFAQFDYTTGKIFFRQYYNNTANTIGPSTSGTAVAYKQNGLEYSNYEAHCVEFVLVRPSNAIPCAGGMTISDPTAKGTYEVKNNAILTAAVLKNGPSILGDCASMIGQNFVDRVFPYRPATVHIFKNECPFDVGQVISVTDIQGVTFQMPIMSMDFSDSGAVLSAVGSEWYEDNLTGGVENTLAGNSADITILADQKLDKTAFAVESVLKSDFLSDTTAIPGNISVIKQGNIIDFYMRFTSSDAPSGVHANAVAAAYCPMAPYEIMPIFSASSPYLPVGSMWISSAGTLSFYGVPTSGGYISSSYICEGG